MQDKFQVPNSKLQIKTNLTAKNAKKKRKGHKGNFFYLCALSEFTFASLRLKHFGFWSLFGIWILVFGICFLPTGCGSSKKASEENPEKVTVRLNGELGIEFAGYYTALSKGYYLNEGLDVRIMPSAWNDQPEEFIRSGSERFGVTWLPSLLVERDKGAPLVNIAQIFPKSGLRIVAQKSSGINQPADFIHKRLGIWSYNREYETLTFLALAGLDAKIVQLIPQMNTVKPFLEGKVDAIPVMVYDGYITLLEKGINTTNSVVFSAATSFWGFPEDGIFVTEKTLQEKPELCERFLRATLQGWQYALDNPGDAAEIVLSYDKQFILNKEHELAGMRELVKLVRPTPATGEKLGYLDPVEFNRCSELMLKQGFITQSASTSAYTHAIWEKATKS